MRRQSFSGKLKGIWQNTRHQNKCLNIKFEILIQHFNFMITISSFNKFYLHIDKYIFTCKIYFEARISEIKQQCLIVDLDFCSKKVEQIFHTFTFSTCFSATLLANITYWHISMTTAFSDEIFFLYRSSSILKNILQNLRLLQNIVFAWHLHVMMIVHCKHI